MLLGGGCETNYVSGWQWRDSAPPRQRRRQRIQQAVDSAPYIWWNFKCCFFRRVQSRSCIKIDPERVFKIHSGVCGWFKVANGSRSCKRRRDGPRKWVIIVIQDKDAYCQRHSVWGGNVGVRAFPYIFFKLQQTLCFCRVKLEWNWL